MPKRSRPLVQESVDDVDEFDLTNADFDLIQGHKTNRFYQFLQILLAISAFLDFSAAISHRFLLDEDDRNEADDTVWENIIEWLHGSRVFSKITEVLETHGTTLGFVFSSLWFIDSFFTANRQRQMALLRRDRQQIMEKARLGERPSDDNGFREWWEGAQGVYYTSILVQLLLLPVGFYIFCFKRLQQIRGYAVDEEEEFEFVYHTDDDDPDFYESYGVHANLCLGFALVKHAFIILLKIMHRTLRQQVRHKGRRLVKTIIIRAIRNPFRFRRRLGRSLRVLRWVKYLAPLFGTSNKLRENVSTLVKRYQQRHEAFVARRIREHLRNEMSEEELLEYCARLIQKTFRAHQCRKKLAALRLLQGSREEFAARRLQKRLVTCLKRGRRRLQLKELELRKLAEKQQLIRKKKEELSELERFRMYTLQEDLNRETNRFLNEKLLIRPNTTFAVTWRLMFVVAVVFEITQLALNPILAKYTSATGEPLRVVTYLEQTFVPLPIDMRPECDVHKQKHRVNPLKFVSRVVLGRKQQSAMPATLPWYCESTLYSSWQQYLSGFVKLSIDYFLDILGVICFLDVFITFFVGEYDNDSGCLGPKPFVKRWILPGILLQLLVNPRMEEILDGVVFVIGGLLRQGPFRVLRWTVAFFFPTTIVMSRYIRRCLFLHNRTTAR